MASTLSAQGGATTGSLLGSVRGPEGSPLPGAGVVVENPGTGLVRHTTTDASGLYLVALLPPARYRVRCSHDGFVPEVRTRVTVAIASRVTLDVILQPAPFEGEIVVTADAPPVETTNAGIFTSVSSTAVADLPLAGRDFTDLVLLTPGAVAGRGTGLDEEVAGGSGGVSLGTRAIANAFSVDGSTSTSRFFGEERGGSSAPFTFSQAAIAELRVVRASPDLRYGASGGIVDVVTRSGSNTLRGEVFGYFRDESLVSANALGEEADHFEQWQLGFAIGLPVIRDRLHAFVSLDNQELDIPTFRAFADFPVGREGDWEARTGLDWDAETGSVIQTNDATATLVKLDWQAAESALVTIRHSFAEQDGANLFSSIRTDGRSHNGTEQRSFHSAVASAGIVLGNRAFEEIVLHYGREDRTRPANTEEIPGVSIGPGPDAAFGQNASLPNRLVEERLELIQTLTVEIGRHSLQSGVAADRVELDNSFLRYGGGWYAYPDWDAFLDGGTPVVFIQAFSESGGRSVFHNDLYAGWLQDEWRPGPRLTVTGGLRYDLQDRDDPPTSNPFFAPTGHAPDSAGLSAGLGFAWDPTGDGGQVLRGGLRSHLDRMPAILDGAARLTNGIETVQVTSLCFLGQACPEYPGRWPSLGDLPTDPFPDVLAFDPDFANPRTTRAWLAYERQVGHGVTLGASAIYSATDRLQRKQDRNLSLDGGRTVVGSPTYVPGTALPQLGRTVLYRSDARAHSRQVSLTARKIFDGRWSLDAAYTWSSSRDQDSQEVSTSTSRHFASDQYDLGSEWGPSSFDVEHTFVLSGSVELPWRLALSGIVFARSGFPFTALHADDLNGDGYRTDRAVVEVEPGVYRQAARNAERQPWFSTMNLRLSRSVSFGNDLELEVIGEVFNAVDRANLRTSRFVRSSGCVLDRSGTFAPCTLVEGFAERNIAGEPRSFQIGAKLRF